MRKRTIGWLSVLAGLVLLLCLAVFLLAPGALTQDCPQAPPFICHPHPPEWAAPVQAGGLLLVLVAGVLFTIAWIGAIIRSVQMQTWGWLLVVLLVPELGALIYGLAGPADRPALAPTAPSGAVPHAPQQ
jgi:hypothetical protein